MKKINNYHDLLQRKVFLEEEKKLLELEIQVKVHELVNRRNWFSSTMKILSSTFKDSEESPFVQLAEGLIYLYRKTKSDSIDPNQSILEHLISLFQKKKTDPNSDKSFD